MPLSVVDLYRKLPRTNCGDCGQSTCLAFASMVVSVRLPLETCPHLDPAVIAEAQPELDRQHAEGKWTQRDTAADALAWARQRAASMALTDLPGRIGGVLTTLSGEDCLELPYFDDRLRIFADRIETVTGTPLDRWEQVFIYNHMAQGGRMIPGGNWKALQEFPNTVSKIKSMREHVETPLQTHFNGNPDRLKSRALELGGREAAHLAPTADVAVLLTPLPRVPVLLVFWDADPGEGFGAQAKLLFDDTITGHLDIESILFLSEHIARRLMAFSTR